MVDPQNKNKNGNKKGNFVQKIARTTKGNRRSATSTQHRQKPQPLDGGWGWAVVFGGGLGHFLLVGLARTLGVFFVDWFDRFKGSAADTVLVQSLFNTIRMVTGPFVGMLCDTVGCRRVVMVGGFVFSMACLISSFATSLRFMYLSFSLMGGLGAGCIFTPMFIMLNQYFDKKKGIAMALATMGSGLGTLVLSPLWTLLLREFGHYGAMFIASGIMMNTIVVGALFRSLGSKLNWPAQRHCPVELKLIVGDNDENDGITESNPKNQEGSDNIKDCLSEEETHKKSSSHSLQVDGEVKLLTTSSGDLSSVSSEKENEAFGKRTPSKASKTGFKAVSSSQLQNSTETEVKESKCESFKKRFAVLKSLTFWIYSFYMAALPCAVQIYVIYLPSLLKEKGFSKNQSALVLSISGGADIAGRFLAGFLFDLDIIRKRRWPAHCLYGIGLGLVTIINGFQETLVGFIAMGLLWGLFEGGYHSQRSTIVSEFITREQIASSVGLMIFWQGIGNMVSPTFAGYLKDVTGTFTVCFYYGGAAMTLCASMFFVNYLVVYYRRKRTKNPDVNVAPEL